MRIVAYDLETNGLLPALDRIHLLVAKVLGEDADVRVYSDNPEFGTSGTIRAGHELLLSADLLVAHNAINFDIFALAKLGMALDPARHFDTLVAARLLDPERRENSLEAWGATLGCPKGAYAGDFQTLDAPMRDYAIQDVVVLERLYTHLRAAFAVWKNHGKAALAVEHSFAWVIALTMRNGFGLDVARARDALGTYTQERHEVAEALIAAFGPLYVPGGALVPKRSDPKKNRTAGAALSKVKLVEFNPASREHIATKLKAKYGWKPLQFTEHGSAKIDEAVISTLTFPEAALLSRYFRLAKLIGQLDGEPRAGGGGGWLRHVDSNNVVRGYINSCGAVTGRCTHSRPNVAQADKAVAMRACWVPTRPGWVLVGIDAEGLELRMLGHYLGRYDGGAFARAIVEGKQADGTDAHSVTRKLTSLHLRNSAKTLIYALIYGAGDEKLGKIIRNDAADAKQPPPPGTLGALGKAARSRVEAGIAGFRNLKLALLNKVQLDGWVSGVDGRRLHIRAAYSALNTLLQSGGAVLMKLAAAEFYAINRETYGVDWAFCANVHDEVQIEARTLEIARRVGAEFAVCIKTAGERLELRCTFSGKFDTGANWSETH